MRYNVQLSDRAENDLDNIIDYITNELCAPTAANNLLLKVKRSLLRLADFPFSGTLLTDKALSKPLRWVAIGNYMMFYTTDEPTKRLSVIRILYASSNYISEL